MDVIARCGCASSCSCLIKDGACTSVAGLGSIVAPYQIGVVVDPVGGITCGPNGLAMSVVVADTDCIDLAGNGTAATPITATPIIAPNGPGPTGTNLLVCNDGSNPDFGGPGLGVSCEAVQDCVGQAVQVLAGDCLAYDDVQHSLSVKIAGPLNGTECATIISNPPGDGIRTIPSTDAGNILTFGGDGRLFVPQGGVIFEVQGDCALTTGSGTVADPYVISVQVDPACPLITCGPNGLCVTPTPVTVLDTATVDMTITGSGQPGDPWVLSAVACAPGVVAVDTPCINVDVAGGANCGDPFRVQAVPIISPDQCNGLECRGNGLFTFRDPTQLADAPFNSQGGQAAAIGPINGAVNTPFGPQTCITVTNPSPCRRLEVHGGFVAQALVQTNRGRAAVRIETSQDGGPFAQSAEFGPNGLPGVGPFHFSAPLSQANVFFANLAPGASTTICIRAAISTTADTLNASATIQFNPNADLRWQN